VQVPPDLSSFQAVAYSFIAQLWFGNKQLHYEAWIRGRLGVIELGLHFEADPLTNARLFAAFRSRERTVRRALGGATRVESWDKGWARVWEPIALSPLDAPFQLRLASRLAAYITALEPILRDELPADVPWRERLRRE
jgi:hypothetical protein